MFFYYYLGASYLERFGLEFLLFISEIEFYCTFLTRGTSDLIIETTECSYLIKILEDQDREAFDFTNSIDTLFLD